MRTTAPSAFSHTFVGPEGRYTIRFAPTDEWDGVISVSIDGVVMQWHVAVIEQDDDGAIALGGMTHGTKPLWGEQFWFELRLSTAPPLIRYWGDQVVWREDYAA